MTDPSKCRGEHCPSRSTCKRFTSKPKLKQTYLLIPSHLQNPQQCGHFKPNDEARKARRP